jgi:hypothetical protein
LAQVPIRITITISKKINGNFGLEYKLVDGLVLSSSMDLVQIVNQEILQNKSVTEEKYLMLLEVLVTQGAVNDNNYSFDAFATYNTKKIADHNFVNTIGNTIFKEWGSGLYATGYDV